MTNYDKWMTLFGWRRQSHLPFPVAQKIMALPVVEGENWRRYKRRVNKCR